VFALFQQYTRWAGLTTFAVFSGVSFSKALAGESSCGCLGSFVISPWVMLVLDGVAIVLIACWRSSPDLKVVSRRNLYTQVGLLVCVPTLLITGSLTSNRDAAELGKSMPLLQHIDIASQLEQGEWVVVFIRPNCQKCRDLLPQLVDYSPDWPSRLALIDLSGKESSDLHSLKTGSCIVGRTTIVSHWPVATPYAVHIENGRVVRACATRVKDCLNMKQDTRQRNP